MKAAGPVKGICPELSLEQPSVRPGTPWAFKWAIRAAIRAFPSHCLWAGGRRSMCNWAGYSFATAPSCCGKASALRLPWIGGQPIPPVAGGADHVAQGTILIIHPNKTMRPFSGGVIIVVHQKDPVPKGPVFINPRGCGGEANLPKPFPVLGCIGADGIGRFAQMFCRRYPPLSA